MPPATKRQGSGPKTRFATPRKQQITPKLDQFTRVSKSIGSNDLKIDAIVTSTPTSPAKLSTTPLSRKRKAARNIQDDSDSSADEAPCQPLLAKTQQGKERDILPSKRGRGRPSKKSRPVSASLKRSRSPSLSDSDQSAINADKLFKRLRIESSPSRASSPLTSNTSIADSEAEADFDIPKRITLPAELLDLVNLHAALLKTLTLHYAHNGSHVPADLRVLRPNVARAWGKKAVSDVDVRICLGVLAMSSSKPLLSLSDYGRAKICIEIDQLQSAGPLDENALKDVFQQNMKTLWSRSCVDAPNAAITNFIESLPKSRVTACESVSKACAVTAKGQQRLADLKQGMAANRQEKNKITSISTSASITSPLTNPDGSKMSLLDRLRLKQMQKASMPIGLSPAEMERRAALQRVDEVAALISMLSRASSGGFGRVSFPMPVMLQKLKDSFRMGISKEEGATCIRLIAKEVAPEWVMVVTINGKENVVVEMDRQCSKTEIARRVRTVTED